MKNHNLIFSRILTGSSFAWLLIPFIIFCGGWMKLYISIPIIAGVLAAAFIAVKKTPVFELPKINKYSSLIAGISIIAIAAWVTTSGIGGYMFQNDDFYYRNAILKDLINHDWPVFFSPDEAGTDSPLALVYYFGYFLPSALTGKIINFDFALFALWLWTFAGITLIWLNINVRLKKISILPVIFLIFFSGADIIGTLIFGKPFSITDHIEWWASSWQYSSMTTQLFWVFNQAVPAWLVISIFLFQKKKNMLVFLLGILFFYSPMPFVGSLPFFVYKMIINRKDWIKDLFSVENIIGGGITGIIAFLFLSTNIAGNQISFYALNIQDIFKFIIFLILEFLILSALMIWNNKKNILFWISAVCLLVFPLILVGIKEDFGMRASIPALFILMILAMDSLAFNGKKAVKTAIILILCIGAVTPVLEINRSLLSEREGKYDYSTVLQSHEDLKPNFLGKSSGNIFFDHLVRR